MSKPLTLLGAAVLALGIQGCANTVKYGEATKAKAITAEVGINELQLATQKLVAKMLEFPSVANKTTSKRPTIAIDTITNQTHENIDTSTMTAGIFDQLTQSGKFRFSSPEKIREEKANLTDMLDYGATTDKAAEKIAKAVNADMMIYGSLANIIRVKPTNKEIYYRINLKLLDRESGNIIWKDEHEILKSQLKTVYGI